MKMRIITNALLFALPVTCMHDSNAAGPSRPINQKTQIQINQKNQIRNNLSPNMSKNMKDIQKGMQNIKPEETNLSKTAIWDPKKMLELLGTDKIQGKGPDVNIPNLGKMTSTNLFMNKKLIKPRLKGQEAAQYGPVQPDPVKAFKSNVLTAILAYQQFGLLKDKFNEYFGDKNGQYNNLGKFEQEILFKLADMLPYKLAKCKLDMCMYGINKDGTNKHIREVWDQISRLSNC